MRMWWLIAQTTNRGLTPQDRTQLVIRLGILMLLVIVGGVAILMIRRRFNAAEEDDSAGGANTGFSLADLREMVKRGELTQAEYDRTKERIVAKVRNAANKKKQPPV